MTNYSKPVVISKKNWNKIKDQIAKNYPPSVLLLRHSMRKVLGFTVREHERWVDNDVEERDIEYGTKYRITEIHLDFYDNPKRTMFLLKYSDFLNDKS
jgi:hypothetical protein